MLPLLVRMLMMVWYLIKKGHVYSYCNLISSRGYTNGFPVFNNARKV
jgi:hypothetical protein